MSLHPQNQIKCPVCHQSDRTILVEDLYFALIENDKETLARFNFLPGQKKSILRNIQPPSLERLPIWFILPPDALSGIILIIFFLLIPLSGFQSGFDQKYLIPVVFLLGYLISRRYLIKKFNEMIDKHQSEVIQTQITAERWSSLFICLHDMTVFSGHQNDYFPINEIQKQ